MTLQIGGVKNCKSCQKQKPFTEYHRNSASWDGYRQVCKACAISKAQRWLRENKRPRRVENNPMSCPICEKDRILVADHCHESGFTRERICALCNAGLGMFHDSPAVLERAAEYLRRHSERIESVGQETWELSPRPMRLRPDRDSRRSWLQRQPIEMRPFLKKLRAFRKRASFRYISPDALEE